MGYAHNNVFRKLCSEQNSVVKAVSEACKKYGVKLGLYYSLWDRYEKCYKNDEQYVQYMEKHLTELMDGRYGEIVELWFDGAWDKPCRAWQLDRLYNLVKTMQPMCQIGVNHTVGKYSERKGMPKKRYEPKNYRDRDPLRMFPSDFRLWDPNMCREDDPKIYTFNGKEYYLPLSRRSARAKNSAGFIQIHMKTNSSWTPKRSLKITGFWNAPGMLWSSIFRPIKAENWLTAILKT